VSARVYARACACQRLCSYIGLARIIYIYTVYDRIFGEFPAKNTIYTTYLYGSGQPYLYMHISTVPQSSSSTSKTPDATQQPAAQHCGVCDCMQSVASYCVNSARS